MAGRTSLLEDIQVAKLVLIFGDWLCRSRESNLSGKVKGARF